MQSSVKDVMTSSVVAVRETAGYKDIVTTMRSRKVSAFPVLDADDHVIGVVSEADLLFKELGPEPFTGPAASMQATGRRGERAKAAGVTAAELMSTPPVTINADTSVADAAKMMYTRRVKRLPVVDDHGRLVGIVSRVDLLSVYDRPGENIRDEVIKKVIAGDFGLDPNGFDVSVKSGIVTIVGQVGRRDVAPQLIDTIRYVEGVVDVRDRVGYSAGERADDAAATDDAESP